MSSEIRRTFCTLDCPDTCGLEVTVDDGRVTKIAASDALSFTQGFICEKVHSFGEQLESDARVRYPRIRTGPKGSGEFRRASWEEALELVADRLRETERAGGGRAIMPLCYGGSNGNLTQDSFDALLFRSLGAIEVERTICAVPTTLAAEHMYGKMRGVAFEDYAEAELIVVWGVNPQATGIHLVPILKRAKKRGAKLVVVDPRRTKLARLADLHLPVAPASDLGLALGVANALFERGAIDREFLHEHASEVDEFEQRAARWPRDLVLNTTGLSEELFERFVDWYANARPAVIRAGWGLERNRHGGSAVCAVLALPTLMGHWRQRGGGYTLSNGGGWKLAEPFAVERKPDRVVNMNRVGRLLNAPEDPVRALFVYNMNPLATLPNAEAFRRGLERDDLFTVVFDPVLTDTALYADVVLPATTFLEHRDLRKSYGLGGMVRSLPVVEPVGESRSNGAVFAELCRKLGFLDSTPDDDELEARILNRSADAIAALERGEAAWPGGGAAPRPFVDYKPGTPDGRVHLVPSELEQSAAFGGLYTFVELESDADHPLVLLSPAEGKRVSSTFGQRYREVVAIRMHPDDLASRGLTEGQPVRVFNRLGEVHTTCAASDEVRRGVAVLPKGLWSHNSNNGATSNALMPDHLGDLGGGACFSDARVEVLALN